MDKLKAWWAARGPSKRRLIQLYAALLTNCNLKGFANGRIYKGPLKAVCVPGLNCYSCPGAVGSCPLGALQNALADLRKPMIWYVLGLLLLFGAAFGRVICGFLCPFGLIQELLHKLPVPKIGKSRMTRLLSRLKYAVLAVLVLLLPVLSGLWGPAYPAFCKYLCPAGTMEGAILLLGNQNNSIGSEMLGPLFENKYILMILIATACLFLYRAFCRFLCPLGALWGFFSRVALFGVSVDEEACTRCGRCIAVCKTDIRRVGDHECVQCGECVRACPEQAIRWKKPGPILLSRKQAAGEAARTEAERKHPPRGARIAGALAALVILAAVIGLINTGA